MKNIYLPIIVFVLTGCSSQYTHPDRPLSQITADWERCEAEYAKPKAAKKGYIASPTMISMYTEECVKAEGWTLGFK